MVEFINTLIHEEKVIIPEEGILVVQESVSLYLNIQTAVSLYSEAPSENKSVITRVLQWFSKLIRRMIQYFKDIFGMNGYAKSITDKGWSNTFIKNDIQREIVVALTWCNAIKADVNHPELVDKLSSNIEKLKKQLAIFASPKPFGNTNQLKKAVAEVAGIVNNIYRVLSSNGIKVPSQDVIKEIANKYNEFKIYSPFKEQSVLPSIFSIVDSIETTIFLREKGDTMSSIYNDIVKNMNLLFTSTYEITNGKFKEKTIAPYVFVDVSLKGNKELDIVEAFDTLSQLRDVGNFRMQTNVTDMLYQLNPEVNIEHYYESSVTKLQKRLDNIKTKIDKMYKDIDNMQADDVKAVTIYVDMIATIYAKFVDYDANYTTAVYLQLLKYNLAKLCDNGIHDGIITSGGDAGKRPSEFSTEREDDYAQPVTDADIV